MAPFALFRIVGLAVLIGGLGACAGGGPEPSDARRDAAPCHRTHLTIEFISTGDAAAVNRIEDSAKRLTSILASEDFERQCNASGMNRTQGRSVAEVCSQMRCAGPQGIRVALYRDERVNTLAFEKRGAVFVNTAKARAGTPANLAHEFAHVLGYSHRSFWGIARKRSVPYVIGRLVRDADPANVAQPQPEEVPNEEL